VSPNPISGHPNPIDINADVVRGVLGDLCPNFTFSQTQVDGMVQDMEG
jgi:hypothetical protein